MKQRIVKLAVAAIVLTLALMAWQSYGETGYAQSETASITNPAPDSTLSDLVVITGSVNFADFLKYEIMLKSGEQLTWVATVYAPVVNGNLARFDTRMFADGTYQLIVRQVNNDTNYTDYVGPTITINNGLDAPLQFPEVESSYLYPPPNHALARVKNCSGRNMEFDFNSPEGFCSAGDLWIKPKLQDATLCTSMDILLIPCEYRGTAIEEGAPRGVTYLFEAEQGQVYEIDFPGGDQIFINPIAGDARADTDTGATASADAQPAAAAASTQNSSSAQVDATSPQTLPVSGQAELNGTMITAIAAALIILLVAGGLFAMRQTAK